MFISGLVFLTATFYLVVAISQRDRIIHIQKNRIRYAMKALKGNNMAEKGD